MAADGALDGVTKPEAVQSLGSQFKKVEVRKKNFLIYRIFTNKLVS
jgi:hypothetical protein